MTDLSTGAESLNSIWNQAWQPWQPGMQADDCAGWMALLYRQLEGELQALDRSRIACTAGCASCCVVNVAVLMPEAIALVRFLRQIESSGLGVELRERVGALYRKIRGLNEQQRLRLQLPCAFLSHQGRCQVYPLRPLMCRSVSSTDPAACRAALATFDAAQAPPVMMNLHQKQLFDQAFIALADALRAQGLDDRSTRLNTAIFSLLDHPELATAWLQGGPVPSSG